LPLKLEVAGFGGASDGFATLVSDGEPPADVEVTKTASPSTGVVGSTLTYTVSIKNLSATRPAYGIHLTDDLPGGGAVTFVSSNPGTPVCTLWGLQLNCDFSCLDPLEEMLVTIDVTLNPPAFSSITNQATISVPEDPITSNTFASVPTPVVFPADVEVVKSVLTPGPYAVGNQVTYSIVVTNHGP